MRICTLIISFLVSFPSLADCNVKMRVYQSPPNYYLDKQGQWTGLVFDLANAVIREAGCTAQYVDMPWNRALKMLELGKIDMMTSLSVTDKRKEFIHFLGVQHEEVISPIVRTTSTFKLSSLDDFRGLPGSVGQVRGAFYGKAYKNKKSNEPWFSNKIVAYNSTDELMDALRKNRLSVFLYDRDNAAYMLSQYPDGNSYKLHPYTVFKNTVYFGLSKNASDKRLLEKLRQSYFRVRESGELSAINEKYRSQLFNQK